MGRGRARIRKFLATRERIPTHPPVGKNLVQEHPFSLMMIQKAIKYKGNTIKMIIQRNQSSLEWNRYSKDIHKNLTKIIPRYAVILHISK